MSAVTGPGMPGQTAFLFDLDGTLIDSVYQHVLAWSEALQDPAEMLAHLDEVGVRRSHQRLT